jgi:hypothetical protein
MRPVTKSSALTLLTICSGGLCGPAMAGSPSPTSQVTGTVAPADVIAEWQRGTWSSFGSGFYLSGFSSEDDYDDLKVATPHPLPLKPKYEAEWQGIRKQSAAGRSLTDTGARCIPLGVPFADSFGIIQFLFAPDRVVMTGIFDNGVRTIFTDGRPHEMGTDPSFNGDSIGHWEGKTLVVDVVNLTEKSYLEEGLGHSSALHVVERWNYLGPKTIRVDVSIDDATQFTRPLHVSLTWKHDPNGRLHEDECENNRDTLVDGATGMIGADGRPLKTPPNGRARYRVIKPGPSGSGTLH